MRTAPSEQSRIPASLRLQETMAALPLSHFRPTVFRRLPIHGLAMDELSRTENSREKGVQLHEYAF